MSEVQYYTKENGQQLAYIYSPPTAAQESAPIVMFCGGYRSDMGGTKATYFEAQCRARGQGYIRFDYSGHGLSDGNFNDGTISLWRDDALEILSKVLGKPALIVGSSMGGWIGLLVALECPGLVKGFIGIAAAPDFTEDLYKSRLNEAEREKLQKDGFVGIPNDYSDEPYFFTKELYEDGRSNLLLNRANKVDFPIHLIQGMRDQDVPWETAPRIQKAFDGPEVDIVFIDDGDHRLSRPEDLELIDREIKALSRIV